MCGSLAECIVKYYIASPAPEKKLAKKYLNFYRRHPLYSIKKSAIFGGVAGFGLATVLLGKK